MERYQFELIPIPADSLKTVGLVPGAMAEAFVEGNRIMIQKADDDAFCEEWNDDCEGCPYCCPECGECLKEQIQNLYGEDDDNA